VPLTHVPCLALDQQEGAKQRDTACTCCLQSQQPGLLLATPVADQRSNHPTIKKMLWRAAQVDARHFHTLGHWSREKTMETILIDLRKEMQQSHNRKLPQPPEGTRF